MPFRCATLSDMELLGRANSLRLGHVQSGGGVKIDDSPCDHELDSVVWLISDFLGLSRRRRGTGDPDNGV